MRPPLPFAVGSVLAAAFLLSSCGSDDGGGEADGGTTSTPAATQLFPDDFEGVCSGATQSKAADYATTEAHKAVYFETYEEELLDQSTRLPSDLSLIHI